jgi:ribosomal protein S21
MKHIDNNSDNNSNRAPKGGDTTSRTSSTQYPSDAVQATPLEVKVFSNNFERAMKAFRSLVQKERILSSYKDKQTYEKPSDRRRRKHNEANRKSSDDSQDSKSSSADKPKRHSKSSKKPE